MKQTPKTVSEQDFDTQIAHLVNMVEAMGRGELSVDQSLDAYEKGVALIRGCRKLFNEAGQKVGQINQSVQVSRSFHLPGWRRRGIDV